MNSHCMCANIFIIGKQVALFKWKQKTARLNVFITLSMLSTVALSLFLAGALFYFSSSRILTIEFRRGIVEQLEQMNRYAYDKIAIIDFIYSLFMSNIIIRENLDPVTTAYYNKSPIERRLETERQMSYMIVTNYLWNEGLLSAVHIFDTNENYAGFSLHKSPEEQFEQAVKACMEFDKTATALSIIRSESGISVYFIKNVFSIYTGNKIASILIEINEEKWKKAFSAGTDENWLVFMYSGNLIFNLGGNSADIEEIAEITKEYPGFQEINNKGKNYFIASQEIDYANLVSVVAAPKERILYDMNRTLRDFFIIFFAIILVSLILITLLSYTVTNPVKKMITYVRTVSRHQTDTQSDTAKAPKNTFVEVDEFVSAFSEMLKRVEMYYTDLHRQQILLKNAEIKALQSQIAPHFLFNVLNTIAWKSEISGNTEIYRMILFLSELLRANILSNNKDFITLKEELDYVRFYIQLQQQRFEDKFTVDMQYEEKHANLSVPRLSIQTLVENAVSHGIEPLSDNGRLVIRVIQKPELSDEDGGVYVEVEDNGIGFPKDFNINADNTQGDGTHTRVGLKNLNQRLILFGGRGLIIRREGGSTVVSFRIPEKRSGV